MPREQLIFRVQRRHDPVGYGCQCAIEHWERVERNACAERGIAEHLRKKVREHYRKEKGHLYCHVCDYSPPEIDQGAEIIELHHTHPLAEQNEEWDEYPLEEAVEMLTPLCPTCHRLAHAKPDQELFSIEEVKTMVGKS